MFSVYHEDRPTFRDRDTAALRMLSLDFPKGFTKVAVVDVPQVGAVFEATNHIDQNWTMNDEVVETFIAGPRSTSVGDVIVDETSGVCYVVQGIGLARL